MNRTGYRPGVDVRIYRPEQPEWVRYLTSDELAQVSYMIAAAEARVAAGADPEDGMPNHDGAVVEGAVLVEDEDVSEDQASLEEDTEVECV